MGRHDCLSSAMRDRLDAAREYLHLTIEWFEPGSPESCGRTYGFWRVRAGLDGWQHRQPEQRRYGEASAPVDQGPCSAEGPHLERVVEMVLDMAERWQVRGEDAGSSGA